MNDEKTNSPNTGETAPEDSSPSAKEALERLFTQEEVNDIVRKRLAKIRDKDSRDPDNSTPDEAAAKLADLSAQVDDYRTRAEKAEAALNEIHVREEKKALCEEYSLHPSLVSFLTGETPRERREQAERLASATRPKYPRVSTCDMSVMASAADFGQPHKPKGFYND